MPFVKKLLLVALTVVGLFSTTGVAHAAVVVGPGRSGHTCSPNQPVIYDGFVTTKLYWQTCAWTDANEVWFTVNLGNGYDSLWTVDGIKLQFVQSGLVYTCKTYSNAIAVRPRAVTSTPPLDCIMLRARGAYAARAYVADYNYSGGATSPTLQVQ